MYQNVHVIKHNVAVYSKLAFSSDRLDIEDDVVKEIIKQEMQKLKSDFDVVYDVEKRKMDLKSRLKLEEKYKHYKDADIENELKSHSHFRFLEKKLKDRIDIKYLKLESNTDSEGILKQQILTNVKNEQDSIEHVFIIKGKLTSFTHYFLAIQNHNDIYVIDPLSSLLNEITDPLFLKFVKIDNPEQQINYFRNSERLQFSSPSCEAFTINLAFYLIRLELFNSISGNYNGIFGRQTKEKSEEYFNGLSLSEEKIKKEREQYNKLHPIISNGISEKAFFYSQKEQNTNFRFKWLLEQESKLMFLSNIKYAYDEQFVNIFNMDLEYSINVLKYIKINFGLTKLKLIDYISNYDAIKSILNHQLVIDYLFNTYHQQNNTLISDEQICNYGYFDFLTQKANVQLTLNDFITIRDKFYNLFPIKHDEKRYAELYKFKIVDTESTKFSFRSGHIYWKNLEYIGILKDTRLKYLKFLQIINIKLSSNLQLVSGEIEYKQLANSIIIKEQLDNLLKEWKITEEELKPEQQQVGQQ